MSTFFKWTTDEVYDQNYLTIKHSIDTELAFYFSSEIFEYYCEEVGIHKVHDYTYVQEKMDNYLDTGYSVDEMEKQLFQRKNYKEFKNHEPEDEEDDSLPQDLFKEILRNKNTTYNIELLKSKLQRFFLKELIDKIPTNKLLETRDEVFDFIKAFEQEFLYEILIPVAKRKVSLVN